MGKKGGSQLTGINSGGWLADNARKHLAKQQVQTTPVPQPVQQQPNAFEQALAYTPQTQQMNNLNTLKSWYQGGFQ